MDISAIDLGAVERVAEKNGDDLEFLEGLGARQLARMVVMLREQEKAANARRYEAEEELRLAKVTAEVKAATAKLYAAIEEAASALGITGDY